MPGRSAAGPARLGGATRSSDHAEAVGLDFTAIDFETANSSPASACSVGLVRVRDGKVVAQTGWAVRFAETLDTTTAPTAAELTTLRDLQARTDRAHAARPA